MSEIILYGHPDSGHACKVALALSLAGCAHRIVWVDIWADPATRPAAFLAATPFAEVPVLTIDGTPYRQSGAILLEIAERFGCLGGQSAEGRVRAREVLMWEANRIGMCLPQLIEARRGARGGVPPGAVEWLRMRYGVDRARFDLMLGSAPFLQGDAPGIGDCAVWGYAQWLDEAGVVASPGMVRWLERMRGLSGMKTPAEFFPGG